MRSESYFAVIVFLAFFGVASCLPAYGQSRTNSTGTGGIHQIRGRVYLPNGKSLDVPLKVELEGTFERLSVETDRNGGYAFTSLAPGNYTLVVSDDAFETTREYVTIDPNVQASSVRVPDTPKVFTVPIYLQAKRGVTYKTGVINAKWANVPKQSVEHYEKGLELEKDGKSTEALLEFKTSAELYPAFAPAHAEVGKIYLKTNQLAEAVNAFRMASRYDPSDFESKLNCGIALLNKRDLGEAETELKEAAVLKPTAVTPRFYMGLVLVQRHDMEGAQRELEAARDLAATNEFPLLHKYLGGIYWQMGAAKTSSTEQRSLYKLAVDELEKYVKLSPKAQDADRIRETITQLRSKLG